MIWEPWLLYMLDGIAQTARSTLHTVRAIGKLMLETKHQIRAQLPKIYSQELLNNLFLHPYTKIDFVMRDLGVSRPTASKYLQELVQQDFLVEQKLGRTKFFINHALFQLLLDVAGSTQEGTP